MSNKENVQIKYTPEQEAAITFRGGSLLVSAAAGSGKTKVLVERLLGYIDEEANIDEFLVITYTRAAAFELREKINEELHIRLAKSPGNTRLRRQSILCRGAAIDTIHTICGEILRENAHLVKLPPDFRIADVSEAGMIMTEVADSVINGIYEELNENPGFNALLDTVAQGRDDKHLLEILLSVYNKIKSKANYRGWLKSQAEGQQFSEITDVSETIYGSYILSKLHRKVSYWQSEMMKLQDEMKAHPDFEEQYSESIESILTQITTFKAAILKGWDEARKHSGFNFAPAKRIKGYEEFKEARKKCIAELRKLSQELTMSSAEHINDSLKIKPAITTFYKLLIAFDEAYAEEKRRRGVADFSDLEHLTLSLLIDEETGRKTALASNLSKRYREIMIDEYQDVNEVQELIFNSISKDENNIFMVGDVKQAIYRFRLADPTIFLTKYERFSEYEVIESNNETQLSKNQQIFDEKVGLSTFEAQNVAKIGTKMHLSKNFRSQAGILYAVNHLFRNIMSREFGELDYTEKEWLVPGRDDTISEEVSKQESGNESKESVNAKQAGLKGSAVTIDIIDMSTIVADTDEESPAATKLEAEHIASEINRLTDGTHFIPDKELGERPIRCSDIVILLRSMKGKAWQYAAALTKRGIQTELPGGEGFFETTEISAAMALLSIIDNPHQDIPLAAVLSGPIYGFTSDELAEIRINCRDKTYYDALKWTAEHEIGSTETSVKSKKVLADLEELRLVVADMPADRFIWHVYNKTRLIGLVGAMSGGEMRKNNLILLAESARRFEQSGYKGIFGFLTYIRKLEERGEDLTTGIDNQNIAADSMDAVKIMSIHKSKGLEFPVVVLANASKQFNYTDIRKNVVFHSEYGIGTMLTDKERRIKYTTLPRSAIQSKLQDEMLSEELRVLYVAMTRAKEKLIITGTLNDANKTLERLKMHEKEEIAPQALMGMRTPIDWILAGMGVENSNDHNINIVSASQYVENEGETSNDTKTLQGEKQPVPQLQKDQRIENVERKSDTADTVPGMKSSADEQNNSKFDPEFKYKYQSAVDLPSKLTVTGIATHVDLEAEKAEWTKESVSQSLPARVPDFLSKEKRMTGAERGVLLHLVMQHINFDALSNDPDMSSLKKQLETLIELERVTAEQVNHIDVKKLLKFLKSELGVRLTKAKNIKREFRFSLLSPAETYFAGGGDDEILIQGVIDCYFEEDGEIVVVDFKTDRVTDESVDEKARKYAPQLDIYADAISRITGKTVKERIIYFFAIDRAYNLD